MRAPATLRAPLTLMRASMLSALQYRADVAFETIRALFEVAWALVPLLVVFGARRTIAGWSLDEALLVTAWFTAEKALLEGLITPSLVATITQIRMGTFDFVLLKPVDAQLLASFGRIAVFSIMDLVSAGAMVAIALRRLHHVPTPAQAAVAAVCTLAAAAILYALNLMVASVAFWAVKVDNLAYLLASLFDAGRWPATVFKGAVRLLFTFVLPLGIMTTFPPLALLGRLEPRGAVIAVTVAAAAIAASRWAWTRAIRAYRSAGG